MFECLDHPLGHPVALGPLRCSALVVYGIIPAHSFKFGIPLTPMVSENKPRNPISANQVVFQKPGSSLGPMVSHCFGFAPL